MNEAMEITTFQLAKGITMKGFIAANTDVDEWLKKQPGFILRCICKGRDGRIIDMLLWRSAREGQRAASSIMTELSESPVHAAIDRSTVDWSIRTLWHRIDGSMT
ncbi:hypothetical protein GM658_18125 [Pseudoduganella eburnea]|uniref:Antibiotic biosynthesis monooxygenase n=1 Tax=Massilia eburnea TaxID=1776165 RepID=A0A6L6QJS4_9BURK|nr:hypothetical protein [Massilia eburnea]MTW12529.1 hypothetical protein [Massilia eburnea]